MTFGIVLRAPIAGAQESPPAPAAEPAAAPVGAAAAETTPATEGEAASEEAPTEAEADGATPAVPEGVEGPLFVVSPPEEAVADDVREIYSEGDDAFASFFWFWLGLIAVIAGIGGVAYLIWGRGKPARSSRL